MFPDQDELSSMFKSKFGKIRIYQKAWFPSFWMEILMKNVKIIVPKF